MARHVYHWKHGWIPLDHAAAEHSRGIQSRRDVAHAIRDLPNVPPADRHEPKKQIVQAARRHNAEDLVPESVKRSVPAQSAPLHPDLVRDLRGGSADKHLVTDSRGTRFSAERAKLHDDIVGNIVAGHKAQDHPAFVMLGGGPASGKSKAAEAAARDFPDAIKIDPDEIKKLLPEYARMSPAEAASFVHEESSYLAKRVMDEALRTRAHVVLDAVGDSSTASVRSKITKARSAGYAVHGRYVTVPIDVAQERAHARGVKSGRVVPPSVIENSHSGVSMVFPEVMHDFDTAALYDNTSEWKLVLSKYRGQPAVVHDLELWRAFLQKRKKP